MMNVRVKLFAMVRDIVGTDEAVIALPADSTASTVIESLTRQYPRLAEWKGYLRIAVNCEYADEHRRVRDGDEVAIIPPVSGG
jgi:molybdopterin converting factor subunit 1